MHRGLAATIVSLVACNAVYGIDDLSPAAGPSGGGSGGFAAMSSSAQGGSGAAGSSGMDGDRCETDIECDSGHCPAQDGVCCDTACNLECEACVASKTGAADGTCSLVNPAIEPDPDAECASEDVSSCGSTGDGCSGTSTSCTLHAADLICVAASCSNGSGTTEGRCDGIGQCLGSATSACSPFTCDDNSLACRTSCSSNSHCVGSRYCNNGNCVSKKANGQSCSSNSQCQSNNCSNGVCV